MVKTKALISCAVTQGLVSSVLWFQGDRYVYIDYIYILMCSYCTANLRVGPLTHALSNQKRNIPYITIATTVTWI